MAIRNSPGTPYDELRDCRKSNPSLFSYNVRLWVISEACVIVLRSQNAQPACRVLLSYRPALSQIEKVRVFRHESPRHFQSFHGEDLGSSLSIDLFVSPNENVEADIWVTPRRSPKPANEGDAKPANSGSA